MSSRIGFIDIETNGSLETVSHIWVIDIYNCDRESHETRHRTYTRDRYPFAQYLPGSPDNEGPFDHLDSLNILCGHNIIGYDLPVLAKLTGWTPRPGQTVVDTLILSQLLFPDIVMGHSLEQWSMRFFGTNRKIPITDWSKYHLALFDRCRVDTELTKRLYDTCNHEILKYKGA